MMGENAPEYALSERLDERRLAIQPGQARRTKRMDRLLEFARADTPVDLRILCVRHSGGRIRDPDSSCRTGG